MNFGRVFDFARHTTCLERNASLYTAHEANTSVVAVVVVVLAVVVVVVQPAQVSFSKDTTEHVAANTRHNQTTQPKHTTPTKHDHTFTAIRTQHLRRTIILQATNRNQEAQHTRHNHQLTLIALATQIDTTHTSQRNHSTAIIPSMNLRVYETQHIRTQNTSRTLTAQQQC